MTAPALHQFVPTLEPSAVGAHVLEIAKLCEELGIASHTFAEHVRDPWSGRARPFGDYGRAVVARPDDVLLYHVAIGSVVADFVRTRPERLVVDHHNITPASWFAEWEPAVVHGIAWGRNQLAELAPRTTLGLADSAFNRGELDALGYARTSVAPILFDTAQLDGEVDPIALERLQVPGPVWLFVGRVAPHKCQHDLIKAFSVFRRVYGPGAVLRIVGAPSSDRYVAALRQLVAALQLEDAVELTGAVDATELVAQYRAADAFVCVSEHEGFCVPLLEAMHHRLPIVAYGTTAVPETLGNGGICLPGKSPATVAAAVHRVLADEGLRRAVTDAGVARLAELDLAVTRRIWSDALASVIG